MDTIDAYFKQNCDDVYDDEKPISMVSNWLFVPNEFVPIFISIVYLLYVKSLGPQLINPNRPQNPRLPNVYLPRFYRVIFLSHSIIAILLILCMYSANYSFWCEPLQDYCDKHEDKQHRSTENMIAVLIYFYYILKIFQLSEGVLQFLVHRLRRPDIQFFHHPAMVLIAWYGVKYAPGGTTASWVVINCVTSAAVYLISLQFLNRQGQRANENWLEAVCLPMLNPTFTGCLTIQYGLATIVCVTSFCSSTCHYPKINTFIVMVFIFVMGFVSIWSQRRRRRRR